MDLVDQIGSRVSIRCSCGHKNMRTIRPEFSVPRKVKCSKCGNRIEIKPSPSSSFENKGNFGSHNDDCMMQRAERYHEKAKSF